MGIFFKIDHYVYPYLSKQFEHPCNVLKILLFLLRFRSFYGIWFHLNIWQKDDPCGLGFNPANGFTYLIGLFTIE